MRLRQVWTTARRFLNSKQLIYEEFGDPAKVVKLVTVSLPDEVPSGHVHVKWIAAPINPADINQIQGVYPIKPPMPAVAGSEGFGRVERIGAGVSDVRVGDHVIPARSGLGTWRTHSYLKTDEVFKIDNALPLENSATIQVNPPTAYRMLKDFADLKPGDVIIQNGANSAVGRSVIQICSAWGVKSVNVVRKRDDIAVLVEDLKSLGADYVVTEEQLVKEFRGKFSAKLALNCVGGKSALLLSMTLADKGVMVTYGGMSRQPLQIPTGPLIFKDIRLAGFWMSRWYEQKENMEERVHMYGELGKLISSGKLIPPKMEKQSMENCETALNDAQNKHDRKQLFILE